MKTANETENKTETQSPNQPPSETTAEPKTTPTTAPKTPPKAKKPAKGKPKAKVALKTPVKPLPKGKPSTKSLPKPSAKASGKYRRHPQNPFREGSGYALAFDILASHKGGIARADLTKEYAKASKKPLKNASYDIAVLLSPKGESATSERHKSCREGYGLRRENSHVEMVLS